jgi:ABC-type sugar transport system ATPase subunit
MTAVIDVHDLHKHFGHVRALDGLDLTVEEGEIHGFLGQHVCQFRLYSRDLSGRPVL